MAKCVFCVVDSMDRFLRSHEVDETFNVVEHPFSLCHNKPSNCLIKMAIPSLPVKKIFQLQHIEAPFFEEYGSIKYKILHVTIFFSSTRICDIFKQKYMMANNLG